MLSLPHLIVLFVIALMIFGPQKLPELARMLGKATAEFRKMTNDFRYALEDEVRELDRQTRIRDEEIAAAARAAQTPTPMPAAAAPEGAVARDSSGAATAVAFDPHPAEPQLDPISGAILPSQASPTDPSSDHTSSDSPSDPHEHEKSSDDNTAV